MDKQYATASDIAAPAGSVYAGAFPDEIKDEAKRNHEKAKEAGREYARIEEAGDAAQAYLVGAMNGPDAGLLDDPMACMAISRVFRRGDKPDWERYAGMTPGELIRMDAAACGGQA